MPGASLGDRATACLGRHLCQSDQQTMMMIDDGGGGDYGNDEDENEDDEDEGNDNALVVRYAMSIVDVCNLQVVL